MDITAAKKISGYLKDVGIGITLQVMDENAFTDDNYDNANDDLYIWSWNADIDPGYILSIFTTGQILNGSDSEYSNPAYDELYVKQAEAIDPAQRKQIIDADAADPLQATRRTRSSGTTCNDAGLPHRQVDRLQLGAAGRRRRRLPQHAAHTYVDLKPKAAAATTTSAEQQHRHHRRGRVVAVVVIGVVALLVLRRRSRSVETE